jgi:RNA polymerase sigma factor (TIGR02999 family)
MRDPAEDVPHLLDRTGTGDAAAFDELFQILYDELHRLARMQRSRWDGNPTLDTTALVHEAYIKLAGAPHTSLENRAHFGAVAARAMRQILCNYARDRTAQKRGGAQPHMPLDDASVDRSVAARRATCTGRATACWAALSR